MVQTGCHAYRRAGYPQAAAASSWRSMTMWP
jgi:hypothetical protein